jgi:hypothetical protein
MQIVVAGKMPGKKTLLEVAIGHIIIIIRILTHTAPLMIFMIL